jgi:hypothetical protein
MSIILTLILVERRLTSKISRKQIKKDLSKREINS